MSASQPDIQPADVILLDSAVAQRMRIATRQELRAYAALGEAYLVAKELERQLATANARLNTCEKEARRTTAERERAFGEASALAELPDGHWKFDEASGAFVKEGSDGA